MDKSGLFEPKFIGNYYDTPDKQWMTVVKLFAKQYDRKIRRIKRKGEKKYHKSMATLRGMNRGGEPQPPPEADMATREYIATNEGARDAAGCPHRRSHGTQAPHHHSVHRRSISSKRDHEGKQPQQQHHQPATQRAAVIPRDTTDAGVFPGVGNELPHQPSGGRTQQTWRRRRQQDTNRGQKSKRKTYLHEMQVTRLA